jgi:xanthine dehydrogenase large subunit
MKARNVPHDSAVTHVAGRSVFIDDRPFQGGELIVGMLYSTVASGVLNNIDYSQALLVDGIHGIFTHKDLSTNIWGPIIHDQPMLVEREIKFYGEVIAVIAGESQAAIDEAKKKIVLDITEIEPIFTIDKAIQQKSFLGTPRKIERGDVNAAFANSTNKLSGVFRCNGQDHFYLESQAAVVYPHEQGQLEVHSSSQHPTETQHLVAEALGLRFNQVVCIVKRMGGGFGGKEAQAAPFAVFAALVASRTGRAARCVITKDDDMIMTGNRHPFQNHWQVCFTDDGVIQGLEVDLYSNGGAYADLSTSVMERAMLHADNAYFIKNARILGTVCRINIHPNTAFRGFGGPQGIATIEAIIEEIAQYLEKDSWEIRRLNCYADNCNTTPYGQIVENNTLPELFDKLHISSDYEKRRQEIEKHNKHSIIDYKGMSMTAVKFGISFTSRFLNQGNALVNVQTDGSVQVSTGGTEMGQGLNVKISQVVSSSFGIINENVQVMPTSTEKNHNTSPTAASSGSDINCAAAELACEQIKTRLKNIAVQVFDRGEIPLEPSEEYSFEPDLSVEHVVFKNGKVVNLDNPDQTIGFSELVQLCYMNRISLGGYAFYKTPGIFFDKEKGVGKPFLYFTNGVCCSEVSIDRFTGEVKVLRSDILMDLGRSINEGIDYGQVCGAFVQGMGWATTENVYYDAKGKQVSHSPTTYKIPNIQDVPREFSMKLLENHGNIVNVRGSKAVGEPPLVLGVSVWAAVKDALRYSPSADSKNLKLPATNEEVLFALGEDE